MNALELMISNRIETIHTRGALGVWYRLTDQQRRTRLSPGVNSVAWCLWHMARCEDAGVNRLVVDRPQVLEEGHWQKRLNIPLRIYGTGMSDDEVADFSEAVDLKELWAYYDAVGKRSLEVVSSLTPEDLDMVVSAERQHKVLRGEGVIGANAEWVPQFYADQKKGWFLAHLGVTHNYAHLGEAGAVAGMLGSRSSTHGEDGKKRAAPEWKLTHAHSGSQLR